MKIGPQRKILKNDTRDVYKFAVDYAKQMVPDDHNYMELVRVARQGIMNTVLDTYKWMKVKEK